jgi:hypothetical protein
MGPGEGFCAITEEMRNTREHHPTAGQVLQFSVHQFGLPVWVARSGHMF